MYVDNDPLVLSHARALIAGSPEVPATTSTPTCASRTRSLSGAARTLDFTQPVALLLLGVLHHISGTDQAQEIVRRLVAALAPGSFLAVNHSTSAVQRRGHGRSGGALEPGRHTADDAG